MDNRARVLPITAKQGDFLKSLVPITMFAAGRGSGKSWIGSYKIQSRARDGDQWLAVSPDAGVSLETTVPTFLELAETLGVLVDYKGTPYPKIVWRTQDGGTAEIIFRSGEKPDKLRGPNKSGLWLDEASYMVLDVLLIARATLRRGGKMGQTMLTMTPRGRAHWTFDLVYEPCEHDDPAAEFIQGLYFRRKQGVELIQASTRDNPFLPDEFYDSMAGNLSSLLAQQELEGLFVDIAGLMFQREWFPIVDLPPADALRIRYWDKAASIIETSSYTAGALIARDRQGTYFVEDIVRGQWSPADRDTVIKQTAVADAEKYGNEVLIYAEQEGGSGGKEVMQQMIKALAGFPVYRDLASASGHRKVGGVKLPGGPKVTRAQPMAAQAEAGNVKLVRGRWNMEFLSELAAFPESSFCDQVDAAAAGINKAAQLALPDQTVASKRRYGVDSNRFGKSTELKQPPRRRKLYNKE